MQGSAKTPIAKVADNLPFDGRSTTMSITELSRALTSRILMFLNPLDRLRSALACRDWAEIVGSSPLLEDVWLTVYGIRLVLMVSVLRNTDRQYRNLRIVSAILSENDVPLWIRVGQHLRQLELINCEWAEGDLTSLLQHCPALENIVFEGCLEDGKLVDSFSTGGHCPNLELFRISRVITRENKEHVDRSVPALGSEQQRPVIRRQLVQRPWDNRNSFHSGYPYILESEALGYESPVYVAASPIAERHEAGGPQSPDYAAEDFGFPKNAAVTPRYEAAGHEAKGFENIFPQDAAGGHEFPEYATEGPESAKYSFRGHEFPNYAAGSPHYEAVGNGAGGFESSEDAARQFEDLSPEYATGAIESPEDAAAGHESLKYAAGGYGGSLHRVADHEADEYEADAGEIEIDEAKRDKDKWSEDDTEADLPFACYLRTNQLITELDVVHQLPGDDLLIHLFEWHHRNLISLRLSDGLCTESTPRPRMTSNGRSQRLSPNDEHPTDHNRASLSENRWAEFIERGESHVRDFKRLPNLRLNFCDEVISQIWRSLNGVATVERLDLKGVKLTEGDIFNIAKLQNLQTLRLDCDIGSGGFEAICTNLRKLEHLYLGHCEVLCDEDGMKLGLLKNLRELFLIRSIGFTDYTLREWFLSPPLETLSLDCSHVTVFGLSDILRNHKCLKTLCLSACPALSDAALLHALRNASRLRRLRIVRCDALTDKFLTELSKNHAGIRSLELIGCKISPEAVDEFKKGSPGTDVKLLRGRP